MVWVLQLEGFVKAFLQRRHVSSNLKNKKSYKGRKLLKKRIIYKGMTYHVTGTESSPIWWPK